MDVCIACQSPLPLWIQPDRSVTAEFYYRCFLPAQVTGGVVDTKLLAPPSSVRALVDPVEYWGSEPVSLFALGTPTIFKFLGMRCPSQVPVIEAINRAGGNAWIDVDDDYSAVPPAGEFLARLPESACVNLFGAADEPAVERWRARCMEDFAQALRVATGVVVATPALAEVVRPYNSNVVLIPNMIDPERIRPAPRPNDGILRIGYGASILHGGADLQLVLPALLQCARLPRTELHFWSVHPPDQPSLQPGSYEVDGVRYHYHPSAASFLDYLAEISTLDIAVAPQADTPINRARSHGKWLEHALNGTAMVVSSMPAYADVEHGVTGFKARDADEFVTFVQRLATDAELRGRMGEAAQDCCLRRHTPRALGPAIRARIEHAVQARPPARVAGG